MSFRRFVPLSFGALIVGLASCGGGAAEHLRPKDFTAAAVTNAAVSCTGASKLAKPLVVDLDSDARLELETTMQKGLTFVSYDCKSLTVVRSCTSKIPGYEYEAASRHVDLLQMKTMDDLSVNLPLSAGKLGGEMSAGRSIDLALVRVGLRSTVAQTVTRADLEGDCAAATHYISLATVGAFSMVTGSGANIGSAAELFGIGANAKSSAARRSEERQGTLESCETSAVGAAKPPGECGSPLRVTLLPISGEATKEAIAKGTKPPSTEKKPVENPCPEGFLFAGGICTKTASGLATLCAPGDKDGCKAECEKGSAESCNNYAEVLEGEDDPKATKNAVPFFKKSCDMEFAPACAAYAVDVQPDDTTKRYRKKWEDALAYAKKGCEMGSGNSCMLMGTYLEGPYDFPDFENPTESTNAYLRGCNLGETLSCASAASAYRRGIGVPADTKKGLAILDRACRAHVELACGEEAEVLFEGEDGTPKDLPRALGLAKANCEKSDDRDPDVCLLAAKIAGANHESEDVVFHFTERACTVDEDTDGCVKLADLLRTGKGAPKDKARAKALLTKECTDNMNEDACKRLGRKLPADPDETPPAPATKKKKPTAAPAPPPAPKKKKK